MALVILWLGSNRWTAMGLARSLEWRYFPPKDLPNGDVIVVLGGGTLSHSFPRPTEEITGAGDRVLYAAHLYKKGLAPNLLLSGGNIDFLTAGGGSPAQQMHNLLEMIGVPSEAMWLESSSRNTYENAFYSKQLLSEKGIDRIFLVTSAMHMPRAVKEFKEQGFEVIPLPTDFRVTEAGWQHLRSGSMASQIFNFFPSAENLALTTLTLKEYLGMLYKDLRGL